MIRGFYTALSAILGNLERQAVVADNVANLSTPGFRAGRTDAEAFGILLARAGAGPLGPLATGMVPGRVTVEPAQGPLQETGVPTDLAIEGDGLFVVQTPWGVAYTRAGAFSVGADGTLVTPGGHFVLDRAGRPIRLPPGRPLVVGPDGSVAGTGQRIALVAWPAGGVRRLGENLVAFDGPAVPGTGRIVQGALEGSGVDLAGQMVDLISNQRQLSLAARILALVDGTLDDATGVGRPR
jgi:flagellar basal-body rod protein FlgG